MGMSQNFIPIETLSSHFNQQPLNQSQANTSSHYFNNTALIEQSLINLTDPEPTSLIVSSSSTTDIRNNDKEPIFYSAQASNTNLIQYSAVDNIVEVSGDESSINYIQIPNTVSVIQVPFNILVANNNLILCLTPEGIALQVQQSQVSNNNNNININNNVNNNESSEPSGDFFLSDRAKNWHKDSDIVNRALSALNNDIKNNSTDKCKSSQKKLTK